jgi:anti-sigma factor RsiW
MKITPELLSQYHDGELSKTQAQDVADALEQNAELRKELAKLNTLSTLLRTHAMQKAEHVSFEGVYKQIQHQIQEESSVLGDLGQTWAPTHAWWKWMLPVGAAAIAAAMLLLWLPNREEMPSMVVNFSKQPPSKVQDSKVAQVTAGDSEIVEVDLGENTGTVIDIEGEAGEHVAVLWVEEPDSEAN